MAAAVEGAAVREGRACGFATLRFGFLQTKDLGNERAADTYRPRASAMRTIPFRLQL